VEDLLKKISSYQLFNFLLSGAIFVAALTKTSNIHLSSDDAVLSFFLYYFIGLVISRIGSLIVEPILKKLGIIKFRSHADYVRAATLDTKLDTLSQENNTYRTLIATFLLYIGVYLVDQHFSAWVLAHATLCIISGMISIIVLFTLAYHKQTKYITSRINSALQNHP